jgi:hypothetical protein
MVNLYHAEDSDGGAVAQVWSGLYYEVLSPFKAQVLEPSLSSKNLLISLQTNDHFNTIVDTVDSPKDTKQNNYSLNWFWH